MCENVLKDYKATLLKPCLMKNLPFFFLVFHFRSIENGYFSNSTFACRGNVTLMSRFKMLSFSFHHYLIVEQYEMVS